MSSMLKFISCSLALTLLLHGNAFSVGPGFDPTERIAVEAFCSSLDDSNRVSCWQRWKSDQAKYQLKVLKRIYKVGNLVRKKIKPPSAVITSANPVAVLGGIIFDHNEVACGFNETCYTSKAQKKLRFISEELNNLTKYQGECLANPHQGLCEYNFIKATKLISEGIRHCYALNADATRKKECANDMSKRQEFFNSVNSHILKKKGRFEKIIESPSEKDEINNFLSENSETSYKRENDQYRATNSGLDVFLEGLEGVTKAYVDIEAKRQVSNLNTQNSNNTPTDSTPKSCGKGMFRGCSGKCYRLIPGKAQAIC